MSYICKSSQRIDFILTSISHCHLHLNNKILWIGNLDSSNVHSEVDEYCFILHWSQTYHNALTQNPKHGIGALVYILKYAKNLCGFESVLQCCNKNKYLPS